MVVREFRDRPVLAVALVLTLGLTSITAQANERLMETSGCISCHRIDSKLIGPSFKDVAVRYRQQPDALQYLMHKVREGGEGVWDDIPMAPNSEEKISESNLRQVIEWILSL